MLVIFLTDQNIISSRILQTQQTSCWLFLSSQISEEAEKGCEVCSATQRTQILSQESQLCHFYRSPLSSLITRIFTWQFSGSKWSIKARLLLRIFLPSESRAREAPGNVVTKPAENWVKIENDTNPTPRCLQYYQTD